MPEHTENEWATIGQVVALFGVRGELKVRQLTDIPNRFSGLDAVYLGPRHTRYSIRRVRPYKGDMIILKLEGVDNANAAEAMRNLDLQIPISQLAELPADSYYQHDILGLRVFTLNGRDLGHIIDIITTGSNDVYAIKMPEGPTVLIPAIKDVIKDIDLPSRTMHIDPLPGLFDTVSEDQSEEEEDESSDSDE